MGCLFVLAACIYKPARVLQPSLFGMTCTAEGPSAGLCIDDTAQLSKALDLRDSALAFVQDKLGPFEQQPRVLFCSSPACSQRFGMEAVSAFALGDMGILVHPKGWHPHILRHEMIHHWQAERFGRLDVSHRLPRWYIEGMAYALSEDPRHPLPREDIEAWRQEFTDWMAAGNDPRRPPRKAAERE